MTRARSAIDAAKLAVLAHLTAADDPGRILGRANPHILFAIGFTRNGHIGGLPHTTIFALRKPCSSCGAEIVDSTVVG